MFFKHFDCILVYIFNLWFFIIKESTQERREASFGYASVLETEAPREQMTFFCLSSGERDPVVALLEREAEIKVKRNIGYMLEALQDTP